MPTADASASPRTRDPVATRAALLHAAMRRFTVLGFERTTTRDVASDAGVNVSLIGRYFGSKEGLFSAVVEQSADAVGDANRGVDGDLVDSLLAGLRTDSWQEFGGEHPLLLLLRDDSGNSGVQRLRQRAVDSAVVVLANKILEGGGDPTAAESVLAMLIGLLTLRLARPHGTLASANDADLRSLLQAVTAAVGAA
jgi:AcrR family transcriptional regulator